MPVKRRSSSLVADLYRAARGDPPTISPAGKIGRPLGAKGVRTMRSEHSARVYLKQFGDPLEVATKIGALDVMNEKVVIELARVWECRRYDAVRLWAAINAEATRYHHMQQPRAMIVNPGAPGGERVLIEIDGEYQEIRPNIDEAME